MKTDEQYDEMVQLFVKAIDTIVKHNSTLESRLSKRSPNQRPRDETGKFAKITGGGIKFVHTEEKRKRDTAGKFAAKKGVKNIEEL